MVSKLLVSSKIHHANDQSTQTGERFDTVHGDCPHSPRHDCAASGKPDLYASDGGAELGKAPRSRARRSRRADPQAAQHADARRIDPLLHRDVRDDLALATEQADSSGIPGAGDFNCIALMDAASCFLLASDLFPLRMPDADQLPIRRLLTQAKRHKQQLPKTLFVPKGDDAEILVDESLRQKIHVVSVPESELLIFIDDARQGFAERFGDGREDA